MGPPGWLLFCFLYYASQRKLCLCEKTCHLETFVNICLALDTDADEMLWGVAHASNAVLDMFRSPDSEQKEKKRESDSYSMYVRIMKSVAEIMNEA